VLQNSNNRDLAMRQRLRLNSRLAKVPQPRNERKGRKIKRCRVVKVVIWYMSKNRMVMSDKAGTESPSFYKAVKRISHKCTVDTTHVTVSAIKSWKCHIEENATGRIRF
jgi:hypothetical protein